MDDPENQAARVFVGGVAPDTEEQLLIERFSKYGNVKGMVVDKLFVGLVYANTKIVLAGFRFYIRLLLFRSTN